MNKKYSFEKIVNIMKSGRLEWLKISELRGLSALLNDNTYLVLLDLTSNKDNNGFLVLVHDSLTGTSIFEEYLKPSNPNFNKVKELFDRDYTFASLFD